MELNGRGDTTPLRRESERNGQRVSVGARRVRMITFGTNFSDTKRGNGSQAIKFWRRDRIIRRSKRAVDRSRAPSGHWKRWCNDVRKIIWNRRLDRGSGSFVILERPLTRRRSWNVGIKNCCFEKKNVVQKMHQNICLSARSIVLAMSSWCTMSLKWWYEATLFASYLAGITGGGRLKPPYAPELLDGSCPLLDKEGKGEGKGEDALLTLLMEDLEMERKSPRPRPVSTE